MPIHVQGVNTRYGNIAQAFKYDAAQNPDNNETELLAVYGMKPLSNSQLEKIIAENASLSSMSSARRTPQEREAALRRSQEAQKLIAHDIVTTAKTKHDLEAAEGNLSAMLRNTIYLRHDGTKEAADFNKKLLMACRDQENHPEVLAQLQYQEIEEARKAAGINSPEQLSALFDASEQELLDRYPAINRYLRMLAETQALAQDEALSPQQREHLQKYQVGMNLMGVVEARMDLMANPVYPEVDPYPLYGNAASAPEIAESMGKLGLSGDDLGRDSALFHPLSSYFDSLKQCSEYYSSGILDRAALVHPDLKNATFSSIAPDSDLMMGKTVVAHTKDGQDFVLTNRMPLKVQSAKEHMKELYDETVKADKWLLTGSKQFTDMQTALNKFLEAKKNPMDRETTSAKAGELAQKAMEYLQYKLEDKGVNPPYTAESVRNLGKNQREQSRLDAAVRILAYADAQKNAVEKDLKNEKLLKEVSVSINASKEQHAAFARNMDDLTMPDVTGSTLKLPIANEDLSALVMLACGSRQVAGDNAETGYADLVKSVLFEGKHPNQEQMEMAAKAAAMVHDAINKGDTQLLSQLVTEGLQQNNKLLQNQTAIDDRFCFLADLGGKAQQIQKNYSGFLENYLLSKEDTQILNAAKAIRDLRAKGLECQRDLALRFGQGMESTKQDAKDLATVCQMYGVNKQFVGKQLDLATSPYGQVPDFAGKCSKQLMRSTALTDFLTDNETGEKLPAVQDPRQMTHLHDSFMQEMAKALQKQQQAAQRSLNVVQQPKEVAPKGIGG